MPSQPASRLPQITATLQGIVGRVLRIDPGALDVEAPFLELGADSLALVEALRGIQETFGVKMTLRQLFEQVPTIAALAGYLEGVGPHPPAPSPDPPGPLPGRGGDSRSAPSIPAPVSPPAPAAPPQVSPALPFTPLPGRAVGGAGEGPGVRAPGLERVLGMQIQAFNQLVAQQLQMLGRGPHPPAPSPIAHPAPGRGGDKTETAQGQDEVQKPVLPTHLGKITKGSDLTDRQRAHLDALVERYCRKTAGSKELTERYRPWLADSRATVGFRPQVKEMLYPLARARSRGSRLWDVDGNEYVDITMGMGVHLFGHDPEFLRETLQSQIREGFELGPRSAHSGEVAQLFCELTGMERAAFTNSGTEAVMTALRLARARTGRTKIAMFAGSYHGHSDGTLAQSREEDGEIHSFPVAPGIPPRVAEDVLVLEYGTDHSLEILRRHARELAAVIVEPIQSRRPDLQPREYLHELRRLTTENGAALIFDEMICGFRLHLGGAQAHFGVRADLATYGKVVGGGLPIGVVAGSAEYMDGIDGGVWRYGDDSRPERDTTFFGGTFCQHPLAMAAARTVLRYLKEQGPTFQENLNARTARFIARLNTWLGAEKLPFQVVGAHSLFRFRGGGNLELLYYHLVEKGVYVWEWRNCFLSTAHTDADLDFIVQAVQQSVAELRAGGFFPEISSDRSSEKTQVGSWERRGIKPGLAPAPAGETAAPRAIADPDREVLFSLYFFGNYAAEFRAGKYDLILDCARFADRAGLSGLWFPERHFHPFGGLSPNPSVLAAALARETERIALRAGSVVLPLHHPVRVAEEWALVDNLSGGRVGISYASGWHPNDFALAPENYGRHRDLMFERGEVIQKLWRGETVRLLDGAGSEVDLRVYPLPSRRDLPVWITIVNNPDTYRLAGEMGAGVLTNLMGQTPESLADNLEIYRAALARGGHPPSAGHVTLLLHTFLGPDAEAAVAAARGPFHRYLESSVGLVKNAVASEGVAVDFDQLGPDDMEYMLELAYQRYVRTAALIGSPESVAPIVEHLRALGVDEIACLVDFGVEPDLVRQSLPSIAALQKSFRARRPRRDPGEAPVRVPLTEAQRDLWTVTQLGPEASLAYLEAGVLEMRGPFDLDLFRRSLQQVVDRHEAVRSILPRPGVDEEPFQEILPDLLLDVPLIDLTALPAARREEAAQRWLETESRRIFDLERGPLIRASLLRLEPRAHRLGFFVHHIVADGLSIVILITEAMAVYEAGRAGRRAALAEPFQFREYARWLETGGAETPEDEAYWLEAFAGELPVFEPPTDRPRPPVRTFRGDRRTLGLPPEADRRLRETSRKQGATFFIGLLAAWSALLHRWTGQDDVVVGGPTARRPLEGGDRLVGHCVDLVPYRSRIDGGEPTFAGHVAALRRFVLAAHEHGGYPVARLLRHLALPHDPTRAPLINAVFNLDPGPGITRAAGLEFAERSPVITHSKFDVALHVLEAGGAVALYMDYLRDLFDAGSMDRLLAHLVTLIDGAAADPSRPLGDLPLLSAAELRQVLEEWNGTDTDAPRGVPIHLLFDEVAARDPQAPAVIGPGEQSLSYGELRERADALAARLRAQGVGPDVPVALEMERSPELIVAMLAVLKAGGCYVPLDPADPEERRNFILEDSGGLRWGKDIKDGKDFKDLDPLSLVPLQSLPSLGGENLACVIYTSGSTGRPKGVAVPHRAIVCLCVEADYLRLGPGDRMTHLSNIAFDAATFEIWGPLLNGAAVVVIPRAVAAVPSALVEEIWRRRATTVFLTTALFNEVVREAPAALAGVRVLFGGEAVSAQRVREAVEAGVRPLHMYGPAESTTFATWYPVEEVGEGRTVPIGRPIGNTRAWVVDRLLRLVPPGTPGELVLGGAGLARGYLGRPGLTAGRFVPSPFAAGARVYRTGDLVRQRPDRSEEWAIEFLGRTDTQVKIRGFRIEPGEVEATLRALDGVQEAVVVAPEGPGGRRLAAFVVGEVEGEAVRSALAGRLPAWMVPASVTVLDTLPVTPGGKVDRRALAALEAAPAPEERSEAPRSPVEEMVAAAWADVLQLDRVGLRDDFFALGGHSLLAGRVLSRLRGTLETDLSLTDFFRTPTVAGLARRIEEMRRGAAGRPVPPLLRAPRGPEAPPLRLSFAQERLWLIDQLRPGSAAYNSFLAATLSGRLDVPALAAALAEIVRRHEVLRTRLVSGGAEPVQVVDSFVPPPLPLVDLAGLPADAARAERRRRTAEEGARPFDLARGPLLRPVLLREAVEEHVLLLGLHHSVCDGWSLEEVLTTELSALYRAFLERRPSPLPELPVQFADFAQWQRQWLQGEVLEAELAWWKERLAGLPPFLDLPADHPRPPVPSGRGASQGMALPPALLTGLLDVGTREGVTLFMVLLAGLQALLHRYSGQDRIAVGTPIANRPRVEVEPLIGFFINTLVLPADLGGDPTFRELLGRVRALTLGAFDHQDLPFEKLVAAVETRRDPSRNPLFQVFFVLQNNRSNEVDLPGLTLAVLPPATGSAQFDLSFSAVAAPGRSPGGDALQIAVSYSTDLFTAPTIEKLLANLRHLLEALAADPEQRIDDLPLLHEPPVRATADPRPEAAPEAPPRDAVGERRRQLASRRQQLAPERLALLQKWVGGPSLPVPEVEISPLVEIRPVAEGSRAPLFFVHPANGHSNSYLALSRHMAPELPLYVLQSPGLTGGPLYAGMEAIAAAYVDALRGVQPHGPYRLGGWCVGGTFAYEMARRLRAQGEEIELLVLVDSHAPEPEHLAPHEEAILLASLAREIAGAAGKSLDIPLDELRRIPAEERLGWVVDTARKLEILPASFSPEQARWHWDVFRANIRAVEAYRPERQPLRAILFRATRQVPEAEGKPSLGWARWITGRLEVVSVEGDHYDAVREPGAETVGRAISDRLAPAPAVAPAPG